jgi:hypothetical protein
MTHPTIGLIVTGAEALKDFQVFVRTLEKWHPDTVLYVLTDSKTNVTGIQHTCKLNTKITLDAYSGKNRKVMEKAKGVQYETLFKDFTYEKANVLRWIFETQPVLKETGIWFMDADIVHLAPLPEIPATATLALCPHYINPIDEAMYGHYNAGMFWLKDASLIDIWCEAGKTSRFFEQAALEVIAEKAKATLHEFPVQVNFGWWRVFQGVEDKKVVQSKFSASASEKSVGICYDGVTLQSIHTHSSDRVPGGCGFFNIWLNQWLTKNGSSTPSILEWKTAVYG